MPFELVLADEGHKARREGNRCDYLPFGVKTLKVRIKGEHKGKLRIRPRRPSAIPGEKFAHEDKGEPPQFVVSWGGGHEDHYELDYPQKRLVHFLVRHVGDGDGDHPLTVEAVDEADHMASLPVVLTYPRSSGVPWPRESLVRAHWQEVRRGLDGACDIRLLGSYAPRYLPRWWPQNRVAYAYDRKPPQVRLHHRRQIDGLNGDVTVYASRPGSDEEVMLARLGGNIGYPLYDMQQVIPELFRFGPQTWALRIWFFWLDMKISRRDLGRYWERQDGELEQAWRGIASEAEGGLSPRSWHELHEIPDAERVDIVFDDDLTPLYAGTDLHWRELWGQFAPKRTGDPVQIQIMNTQAMELVKNVKELERVVNGWGQIILSRFAKHKPPYMPHLEVAAELRGEGTLAADPIGMESHTPAFFNVKIQRHLTSTDVRDA